MANGLFGYPGSDLAPAPEARSCSVLERPRPQRATHRVRAPLVGRSRTELSRLPAGHRAFEPTGSRRALGRWTTPSRDDRRRRPAAAGVRPRTGAGTTRAEERPGKRSRRSRPVARRAVRRDGLAMLQARSLPTLDRRAAAGRERRPSGPDERATGADPLGASAYIQGRVPRRRPTSGRWSRSAGRVGRTGSPGVPGRGECAIRERRCPRGRRRRAGEPAATGRA